ncbi:MULTISPECIES: sulfite exporter TauE/SafE family protein [unclassified Achromobacter]|uniref:sulfite exporter TauE/SafE family protein n=1 Tax=unclassified Achromobacter TaxID=2626865 RepID=UPI000B51D11C|nr:MULTISPECIES: sulfite exporter TauE/SafE family protein [unclassified Achromobacter]OWT79870.1 permease [Achromobacter sp. HZ34]OWT81754.1 permease [Achromobacter sp. HZ28]
MSLYFLLALFGCLAGVTTVLFGFGGGFVVVPLLYKLLTLTHPPGSPAAVAAMQIAVATSTCVMIFGAAMATRRHQRAGNIEWPRVRPLLAPIALGAAAGAAAATLVDGNSLRWAFAAYLALTILDCVFRPGFMSRPAAAAGNAGAGSSSPVGSVGRQDPPMRSRIGPDTAIGLVIGVIAAFLGVGGSVMTVPLMRRRGADMTRATAMANPLSLPVALAGAAAYVVLAWQAPALGAWHIGYVDLRALLILIAGSWLGIRLTSPFIGKVPDRVHARVYVGLLVLVLLAMLIR